MSFSLDRVAPSATALRVAALRALHQVLDQPPVFSDPLARRILGPDEALLLEDYRRTAHETGPLRATLAARGVTAEIACIEAAARGVTQIVVLGAGLDTYAYRQRDDILRVFEVDRDAMQAWKRDVLRCARIEVPPTLTFVAADIERDDVLAAIRAAGFEATSPAVFVMLGVSFYVSLDRLLGLLGRIGADCAPGTEIVFDYSEPLDRAPARAQARYRIAATRVAAGGEPWITFFTPDEIGDALRRLGFTGLEDVDARAQNTRWFDGRTDGLKVVPLAHLVRARVAGAPSLARGTGG